MQQVVPLNLHGLDTKPPPDMNNSSSEPRRISGLHQIIDQFDILVTDQYGVLHDGRQIYEGVIDCLHKVKQKGKKIAALSNSGGRAAYNRRRLESFGYSSELFDTVLTSGETTYFVLSQRELPFLEKAKSVYVISSNGSADYIDKLGYNTTSNPEEADFVIVAGANQSRYTLEQYCELLKPAMKKRLPCICANPDTHSLLNGTVTFGPAAIAQCYAQSGAQVIYYGKPHLPIYDTLIARLAQHDEMLDRARILCIGDSLAHDIKGANTAGMMSALVNTGLQSMDLHDNDENPATPDFVLPALIW